MCTKKYNYFCQARGPNIGDGSNKGQFLCARDILSLTLP